MSQFDQREQTIYGDQYNAARDINIHLPPPPPDEPARQNRAAMLTLVENTWIKGVLDKSLHGAALLALGLQESPGAVQRPYDTRLRQPDRPGELLPHDTRLGQLFEQAGRTLLILGQPGAGKTTLLLELARDLISLAREEERQPVPVVFNLSGWQSKAGSLDKWLLEELRRHYSVGKRIAGPWLERNNLCLLLDGLDEVAEAEREHCVAAINAYREAQGPSLQLVVCSRLEAYERLSQPLHLSGAVTIQPLTDGQIEAYLAGSGVELQAVRRTLQIDPALRELVETPLLLSLMVVAYAGRSLSDLHALPTPEARRSHILETYIGEALLRRPSESYPPEQTRRWLAWLAHKMTDHSLPTFFIEGMQPAWLPTAGSRLGYGLAVRLSGGIAFILAGGLGFLIALALDFILTGTEASEVGPQIVAGLAIGGVAGLAFVLSSLIALRLPAYVAVLVTTGLIIGVGTLIDPARGLLAGLLFGIPGSLAGLALANPIRINIDEWVAWSWPRALGALALTLVGAAGVALPFEAVDLANVLAIGVIIGLGAMLAFGTRRVPLREESLTPDKRLRYLRLQAGRAGLIVISGAILLGVPVGLLDNDLMNGITFGLIFGLPVGLAALLFFGGAAYIQHVLLRLALWWQGEIGLQLVHFLDYAADRILLHKVGGGYSFRHRLLLEYFSQNSNFGGEK